MSLTAGFWVLAVIGVLGELGPRTDSGRRPGGSVYLSTCTSLAVLLIWGILPALAAQVAASVVAALRSRLGPLAAGLAVARAAAAITVAAVVATVSGLGAVRPGGIDRSVLLDLILTILAWLTAYYGPVIIIERWLRDETWRTLLRRGIGAEVLTSASLLFLAPVIVAEPRGWTFALLALPLLALNQLAGLVNRQAASLRRDSVTGLLNQRGLADVASELGRRRGRVPGRYAVLLIRLHNARDLDDAFGRRIVDKVLSRIAGRLVSALGEKATVGRPDTDDLVVLVPRARGSDLPEPDPVEAAATIVSQAVEEPVLVDGLPYDPAATIGIARSPEDAEDLASLLREADAAIRAAQRGERVVAYTPTPQEDIDRRLGLLIDLNAALTGQAGGGQIEFVYQPQVRLDSDDVVAVEALLRWTHPERGAVSPDDLFAVAEPTPLIHDLTTLAIATVTRQLREWNDLGLRLQAAVNVSMRDLGQDRQVDEILDGVDRAGIAATQLIIEITESEIISDLDQVRRSVDRLGAAGIQLAVDDFGSGFASLQHLRQLNLSQLKLDKGLVRTTAENPRDRAVVRSVIELAHALDLTVVAEGVENRAVHETLRQLGCQMGQGWYYGYPTTGPQVVRNLAARDQPVGGPAAAERLTGRRRTR